ncbi:hypothetical protein A0J61_01784 [Choanephora cucurbitarum]|uniref:Uncharacterized protein n=1 Tax=Choanephora cucurbitarum TaxID=101091 RepID=A0A1C7NM66_9FUNG|nr:hypothetical protein A0J61_01784 [Choanephora cucurbitarum]
MEAIDDYANENIARSLAYTVLDQRQHCHYAKLLPISSQLLRQRVQILGPPSTEDSEEWDRLIQWQEDHCPDMIKALSDLDRIYQAPVYYRRLDIDTLHAMIEFAEKDAHHYVVILTLEEEGEGELSDLKYYNTKELTDEEWRDVFENWSRTIEDAERIFLTKVTRKRVFTPDSAKGVKEAPDDYWGDWSSEEETDQRETKGKNQVFSVDQDDSDEEAYYTRWSQDPGTLTPGPEQDTKNGRILHDINQQEIAEEYDQSYNPLFTVPSVPNLMDTHTAALSELTQMLQNTIPQNSRTANRPFVNPMTQINPLPKAVSRLRSSTDNLPSLLPGTYPESGQHSPKEEVVDGKML